MQSNIFVNSLLQRGRQESVMNRVNRTIGRSQASIAEASVPGSAGMLDSAGAVSSILRGLPPSTMGLANSAPGLLETLVGFERQRAENKSREQVASEDRAGAREVANLRNRGALAEQLLVSNMALGGLGGTEGMPAGGIDQNMLQNLIYLLENGNRGGIMGPPAPTKTQKKKKSAAERAEEYSGQ